MSAQRETPVEDPAPNEWIVYSMTKVRLPLPIPTPLLTINARRRMHWREQARHTREQRTAVAWTLATAQREERDDLLLFPKMIGRVKADVAVYPHKGMKRHDDSAIWEALKPIFDGLQDYELVKDDRQVTHGDLTWHDERLGLFVVTLTQDEESEAA